jgi:NAD(P)-dependent dehydrogenase (short-subunit alcohol dehydrogenase family)
VATAGSAIDFRAELLRIASDRTGYPADMLDLNAAIEADLGIDSIKRVEILGSLQRLLPVELQSAMQAGMEKLTRARTFGDMLRDLDAALQMQPATAADAEPLLRLRMITREIPAELGTPRFYPGRVSVITDDERGIAPRLAASLKGAGEKVVLLGGKTADTTAADSIPCDLADEASVATALETVRRLHGPVGALIHLFPLRAQATPEAADIASWRQVVQETVRSLYLLVRASQSDLEKTGPHGGALIAAVTARGGTFGQERVDPIQAAQFGVADFLKTLALELDGVSCRVIDVDPTEPAPVLHQKLLDELTALDDTLHVGRPGDRRLAEIPQIAPIDDAPSAFNGSNGVHIDHKSVVVLTGGARGITSQIARELAARYQPTLILVGGSSLPDQPEPPETAQVTDRTQLKAVLLNRLRADNAKVRPVEVEAACQKLLREREIRLTVRELEAAGSRVEYHAVDVRDEASLGSFLDGVYRRHGRLDVFIHGAGIIEDKLLRDKTPQSFDRVVHTKADSAFLLARLLRPKTLKGIVFMSSISAVFGNRGQSDYAAANGIMNGIAISLSSRWKAKVVAMAWGPWDQGGMVTDEVRRQFQSRGVQLIAPKEGALAVLRELQAGTEREPLIVSGGGPWVEHAAPAVARPTENGNAVGVSV